MRGMSLGPILTRVERLEAVWPSSPETTFISWMPSIRGCPRCAADLIAHAQATALAAAVKGAAPGAPPPILVFYDVDALPTCPQCGAPLL